MTPSSTIQMPRRRWHRRKHARVDEILAAAAQIAAEKGYEKLRMAEVAERAGVTKGTVYLYFINKDDLIRRVLELMPTPEPIQAAEKKDLSSPAEQAP